MKNYQSIFNKTVELERACKKNNVSPNLVKQFQELSSIMNRGMEDE